MSSSTIFATNILKLVLQNIDFTGIGDAGGLLGSVADGNLYVGLHTADPGVGGTQETNEATYTGYGRVSQARNATVWDVAGAVGSNLSQVTFGLCSSGTESITYVTIGTAATGAGILLFKQAVVTPLSVAPGVTPIFSAGLLKLTVS